MRPLNARFEYDLLSGPQAIQRLNRLNIKRDAFARISGVTATSMQKIMKGETIPHWMHLLIRIFEECPQAIPASRQLAAEVIKFDFEHPQHGKYPFLEAEHVAD